MEWECAVDGSRRLFGDLASVPTAPFCVGILRCLCGGYDAVPFSHKIVKLCILATSVAPVFLLCGSIVPGLANPENGYHGELGSAKEAQKCLDFSHSW